MPQPTMPEAATSPYGPQARARSAGRKPTIATKGATKKVKAVDKPVDSLSRGALAGRIAAGAAIGSAAIAGALLFAGKIDGKTPKRVWDKVKQPGGTSKRSPAKKSR
jgi:hypothetical protein